MECFHGDVGMLLVREPIGVELTYLAGVECFHGDVGTLLVREPIGVVN